MTLVLSHFEHGADWILLIILHSRVMVGSSSRGCPIVMVVPIMLHVILIHTSTTHTSPTQEEWSNTKDDYFFSSWRRCFLLLGCYSYYGTLVCFCVLSLLRYHTFVGNCDTGFGRTFEQFVRWVFWFFGGESCVLSMCLSSFDPLLHHLPLVATYQ